MKTKSLIPALLLAATAALPLAAGAQGAQGIDPERREALREKWQSMTPEQRAAAREKIRERRESKTPEQREAAKDRAGMRRDDLTPEQRAKLRERVEDMTPEQREALRKRVAEHRAASGSAGN
ncbi:MAG: hypothetical protein MZW92_57040 [Comamonadaceae bacterium]|nr:hypothetical protein [Comamonadaceae bacterium]